MIQLSPKAMRSPISPMISTFWRPLKLTSTSIMKNWCARILHRSSSGSKVIGLSRGATSCRAEASEGLIAVPSLTKASGVGNKWSAVGALQGLLVASRQPTDLAELGEPGSMPAQLAREWWRYADYQGGGMYAKRR